MATEWMPLTRYEPRSWLLADGQVITEPALEQTSTGMKVRVAGTKASYYARDLDSLLWESAEAAAKHLGTTILIEIVNPDYKANVERNALGFNPAKTAAQLHVVHNPTERGAATELWWRFKVPNQPYEALLAAKLVSAPIPTSPSRQLFQVTVSFPTTDRYRTLEQVAVRNSNYSEFISTLTTHDYEWREFVRDNRPNWNDGLLHDGLYVSTAQQGIEKLLEVVRHFEELDTIQIPNVADPANPGWMKLELYETNVNAEFISDMTEWIDANPAVEGVLNAYQNLLQQLSLSGFTVNEKATNDFLSALLSGNAATIGMEVTNALDHNGHIDRYHTVSIHLPTGTMVVECAHATMDQNAIAEQWEEARTIAQLSGEEDVLVEYARTVAHKEATKKAKLVLKSRQ